MSQLRFNRAQKLAGLLTVLMVIGIGATGYAQETEKSQTDKAQTEKQETVAKKSVPISDLLRDHGDSIIQVNEFPVVVDDITRLLTDLGQQGLSGFARQLLPKEKVGVDVGSGMVFYSGDYNFFADRSIVQFQIKDRAELLDAMDVYAHERDRPEEKWVAVENREVQDNLEMLFWPWSRSGAMRIKGNEFLLRASGAADMADEFLDSKLLKPRLHEATKEIINQSGISLLALNGEELGLEEFESNNIIEYLEIDLSESEKAWLAEFSNVVRAADLGVVGLKYHKEKALQIRGRAQLKPGSSFENLINLEAANDPWQPDLGMEAASMVASAAFKMDTFTSSAAPRMIPQALLNGSTTYEWKFLRGDMLRILASLCGDSWNELTAARVGLYLNNQSGIGQLCILGVVDAKDPDQVLVELERIASLTSPMQNEDRRFRRNEEIRKLVEQLASADSDIADRAETRLRLVGKPAREPLRALRKRSTDQALISRITSIIKTINRMENRSGSSSDPMFWTTLNPGLRLKQNTSTMGEFPVHEIEITPDPSKSEAEVAKATRIMQGMFGPQWNAVQVVQVKDHFVFMLGSDPAKLKRMVDMTNAGKGELADQMNGVGYGARNSQMHAWFNAQKVAELFSDYELRWNEEKRKKMLREDKRLCWLGITVDRDGLEIDTLIPAAQIVPFVMGGF